MATLAVATPSSLVLLKPTSSKKPPISVPVTPSPTACAWASDNSSLVIAIGDIIERCDTTGTSLGTLHQAEDTITALVSKDKGNSVVFATGSRLQFLDASTGKIGKVFEAHKETVCALSLSSDTALLASVSPDTVYVHHMSQGTQSALRGLPADEIATASFHTHSRTKLLVGVGSQLAVYDASKPTAPVKVIPLEKVSGKIISISCSPYSRSLVAVACGGGSISIVDLEKDKGPRSILLRVPITSMTFSAEGGHLYVGTEDGKVLIVDLRALDKSPKAVPVNDSGERVICMSILSKPKIGEAKPKSYGLNSEKLAPPQEANKATPRRTISGSSAPSENKTATPTKSHLSAKPPAIRTRTISATATSPRVTRASPESLTAVPNLAAPRIRSRTVSGSSETHSPATSKLPTSTSSKPTAVLSKVSTSPISPRVRKVSTGPQPSPNGKAAAGRGIPFVKPALARAKSSTKDDDNETVQTEETVKFPRVTQIKSPTEEKPQPRTRTTSAVSRVSQQSTRTRTTSITSQRSQPTKASGSGSRAAGPSKSSNSRSSHLQVSSRPLSRTDAVSPIPPVPPLPDELGGNEQLTSIMFTESRTSSPDLAEGLEAPTPTILKKNKGKGRELAIEPPVSARSDIDDILKSAGKRGLPGESETEIIIQSIEVQRKETENSEAPGPSTLLEPEEATIKMTVQISPRSSSRRASSAWPSNISSPMRTNPHGHVHHRSEAMGTSTSPGAYTTNPAHDLLQNLIRDAMYDFRRETKSEIIGLHLDLVRMGRGWRKELKEVLDTWTEELKEVREENRKLREENERLRRGY